MTQFQRAFSIGFLFGILLFCFSCTSPGFLEDNQLQKLSAPKNVPSVILAERTYTIKSRSEVTERNHLILVAGSKEASRVWLTQQSNPINPLISFNIRLIRNGKTIEKENEKDLYSFADNGYKSISEQRFLISGITNSIQNGDWVEFVSESSHTLTGLGLSFSLDEFPETSSNISLVFISPDSLDFNVFVKNDTLQILKEKKEGLSYQKLFWAHKKVMSSGVLESKTKQPVVFATPGFKKESWNSFGSFYRDLIKKRTKEYLLVRNLADSLTAGLTNPEEKMGALFNYCQSNYRYEQVYLTNGEFIPNSLNDIIHHKYADCKDYSLLIWSLARSVDIPARFALVMRERGIPFYEDVPANQFNHVIVEWTFNGITHWYDGTNRISIPGLPGDDLINQKALVIGEQSSEIKVIKESGRNRIDISGNLQQQGKNLSGNLSLSLKGEYALTMNYLGIFLNELDFKKFLHTWLLDQTNQEVTLSEITWEIKPDHGRVNCKILIPNCISQINGKTITSFNRIFSGSFPLKKSDLNSESLFYYPGFSRGNIDLTISGKGGDPVKKTLNFDLPAGPFYSRDEKSTFIESAQKVIKQINQSIILREVDENL